MFERLDVAYVNHLGDRVSLSSGGVHHNNIGLRDWAVDYESSGDIVTKFAGGVVERTVSFVIAALSDTSGLSVRDRLCDIAMSDILAKEPGRLYVGEWFVDGYFIESNKDRDWISARAADYTMRFVGSRMWRRESTTQFKPEVYPSGYKYLDFPIGFPFDLSPNRTSKTIVNNSSFPSGFRLVVYGPAVNPYVRVAGNLCQVNVTVGDGGLLTVDSNRKQCILKSIDGIEESVFSKRSKGAAGSGSYAFERIPPGLSTVSWDNSFGFDLTIIEERAEPSWT